MDRSGWIGRGFFDYLDCHCGSIERDYWWINYDACYRVIIVWVEELLAVLNYSSLCSFLDLVWFLFDLVLFTECLYVIISMFYVIKTIDRDKDCDFLCH